MSLRLFWAFFGACLASVGCANELQGLTFSKYKGQVLVPLRATAQALGLEVTWDDKTQRAGLGSYVFDEKDFVLLFDDTKLFPLRLLEKIGATVHYDTATLRTVVSFDGKDFDVRQGPKRVEVSIEDQLLRAWQGDILVMETRVSTGRPGFRTPTGSFTAGPVKEPMHYSRLYHNSPMPWSVQVHGNVFIHGHSSVPKYPASHGCVRMPLWGKNAARYFYDWVEIGTPVSIAREFADEDQRESGD